MSRQRVLVLSHGHPSMSKGGGEIAAYQLHAELIRQGHESLFVAARAGNVVTNGGLAAPGHRLSGGAEVLLDTASHPFHLGNSDLRSLASFRRLLEAFRPTIVNFHHYLRIGVEAIREVKRHDATLPVVLTLHEYLGICHRDGQMLKTNGRLCFRSTPEDCATCFPERSPAEFYARKRYIQSFFQHVDAFVSPSRFLIDRYIDWGLPKDKFVYIENGQAPLLDGDGAMSPPVQLRVDGTPEPDAPRQRFAYFGQVTPYKGVDLLLDAAVLLSKEELKEFRLEIHGAGLEAQSSDFRSKIEALHAKVRPQVTFHGEYEHSQLGSLISRCDWVVVPSLWWENSPLVIQEAFKYDRPVICAGVGGMAEKVDHMKTGLHFRAQNARDLAETLAFAARARGLWSDLVKNIAAPPTLRDCALEHLRLFERLQNAAAPSSELSLH